MKNNLTRIHDCAIGPEPCPHGSLAEHRAATDAICLDGVSFRYPSSRDLAVHTLVLRDVTLHVEQGCSLGIIGPNGAGKTTLLRIMLGLLEDYSGSVRILGLTPQAACRRGDLIGYVPQRNDAELRFPLTVRQVVRMGLIGKTGPLRWYSRGDRQYVELLMEQLGIAPLADRPIGDLSGGQQQRCFIARALAAKPKILILDEPLVGVDEAGQQQFAELCRRLHKGLDLAVGEETNGERQAAKPENGKRGHSTFSEKVECPLSSDGLDLPGSSTPNETPLAAKPDIQCGKSQLTLVIVSHDIRAIAASCSRVACLNQSIHYHDSPSGLTEDVLREVFQHEISSVLGPVRTSNSDHAAAAPGARK